MLFVLVCLVGVVTAAPTDRSPADIPSPNVNPELCGRPVNQSSWICNPDLVLSNNIADWFDSTVLQIKRDTSNATCGDTKAGYEIASAWIQKMRLNPGESAADGAQRFARTLHDIWGVGNRKCNNGVLLFVSITDRQVYITTGAGIKPILTDSRCSGIIDNMKTNLRNMNYDGALRGATNSMSNYLTQANTGGGGNGVGSSIDYNALYIFLYVMAGVVGCCIIGWIVYCVCKTDCCQGCCDDCCRCCEKRRADPPRVVVAPSYPPTRERYASHSDFTERATEPNPDRAGRIVTNNTERSNYTDTDSNNDSSGVVSAIQKSKDNAFKEKLKRIQNFHKDKETQENSCPICLEEFTSLTDKAVKLKTLDCGHKFCKPCITKWYETEAISPDSGTCPICRQAASLTSSDGVQASAPPMEVASNVSRPVTATATAVQPSYPVQDPRQLETQFRMQSLQRQYPQYIPVHYVDNYSNTAMMNNLLLMDLMLMQSHNYNNYYAAPYCAPTFYSSPAYCAPAPVYNHSTYVAPAQPAYVPPPREPTPPRHSYSSSSYSYGGGDTFGGGGGGSSWADSSGGGGGFSSFGGGDSSGGGGAGGGW